MCWIFCVWKWCSGRLFSTEMAHCITYSKFLLGQCLLQDRAREDQKCVLVNLGYCMLVLDCNSLWQGVFSGGVSQLCSMIAIFCWDPYCPLLKRKLLFALCYVPNGFILKYDIVRDVLFCYPGNVIWPRKSVHVKFSISDGFCFVFFILKSDPWIWSDSLKWSLNICFTRSTFVWRKNLHENLFAWNGKTCWSLAVLRLQLESQWKI